MEASCDSHQYIVVFGTAQSSTIHLSEQSFEREHWGILFGEALAE